MSQNVDVTKYWQEKNYMTIIQFRKQKFIYDVLNFVETKLFAYLFGEDMQMSWKYVCRWYIL